jgi:hypothetical protein
MVSIWAQFASSRTGRVVRACPPPFARGPTCQRPRSLRLLRPTSIPTLRRHQWPLETAPFSLCKEALPWPRPTPEQSPLPHANHDWALAFPQVGASSSKGKAKAKAPPPKKERAGRISRWRPCRPYTTRTSLWACAMFTFPVAGTSTPGGCRSLRCLAAA